MLLCPAGFVVVVVSGLLFVYVRHRTYRTQIYFRKTTKSTTHIWFFKSGGKMSCFFLLSKGDWNKNWNFFLLCQMYVCVCELSWNWTAVGICLTNCLDGRLAGWPSWWLVPGLWFFIVFVVILCFWPVPG